MSEQKITTETSAETIQPSYYAHSSNIVGVPATDEIEIDIEASAYDFMADEGELQKRENTAADFARYAIPSTVAGFIDTVGLSFGLMDDTDMEETLKTIGNNLGDYYSKHRETARLAGDMVGMFVPGLLATKAVRTGTALNTVLRNTPVLGKSKLVQSLWTSGQSYDRALRAVRHRDLYLARRGQTNLALMADDRRKQFVNRAIRTKLLDTFKENVAFELGVLSTMNASDVLYPEEFEWYDHLAFNSALPLIGGAAEFAYLKKLVRNSAQNVAPIATAARQPIETPVEAMQQRPGNRHVRAFYTMANKEAVDQLKNNPGSAIMRENMNKESLQLDQELADIYNRMARDKPLPDVTNSIKLSEAEMRTMRTVKSDPYDIINTISIERAPETLEQAEEIFKNQAKAVNKLDKKIAAINDELSKISDIDEVPKDLLGEITKLQTQRDEINALEFYIKEPTGELIPLSERKPIFQDGSRAEIRTKGATQNEPRMFAINLLDGGEAGVTDDFTVIVPGTKEETINRVNVTKIFKSKSEIDKTADTRLLLEDMGKEYHIDKPKGKALIETLPVDLQRDIHKWKGSAGSSQLRKWAATNDPRFQQIYQANEPMRARLRELADADGTIPLLRGESAEETRLLNKLARGEDISEDMRFNLNDTVSMTSNIHVAASFGRGGNIVVRRVPVDDVVMIIGGLGDEFEYIVTGNTKRVLSETVTHRKFNALGLTDRSKLYASIQRSIERYKPGKKKILVTHDDHHTKLDAIAMSLQKHGDAVLNDVQMPQGLYSMEDLEYLSLASKYSEFQDLWKYMQSDFQGLIRLSDKQKLTITDIEKMLNLPISKDGTPGHVSSAFINLITEGVTDFRNAVKSLDDFRDMIQFDNTFPEILPRYETQLALRGNMMGIPENMRPVLLVKNPTAIPSATRESMLMKAVTDRQHVTSLMATSDQYGAGLIKTIYDSIEGTDARHAARQVGDLVEGGQFGTGAVTTAPKAGGENAAIRAAHDIQAVVIRKARTWMGDLLEPHIPTFTKLRAKNNQADLEMYNLFTHARLHQWDLLDEVVTTPDGLIQFKLNPNSAYNKKRWQELFGEEIPEEALMPSPAGRDRVPVPLAISQLAFEGVSAINGIGQEIFNNMNHIRRIMGQSPMRRKPWWIPPRNFNRKETKFLYDESGELYMMVAGRTEADAKRKAQREIELALQQGRRVTLADRSDVEKYFDLNDKGFENLVNFSDILLQTPQRATGRTVGNLIESSDTVLNEALDTLTRQMESTVRRTLFSYFEPEIQYAKHLHEGSGVAKETAAAGQSIWQQYISAVAGNPTLNPNQWIGKGYFTIEQLYDKMLNRLHDTVFLSLKPGAARGVSATRQDRTTFEALDKTLGEFNPFRSALDFAQRNEAGSMPPSMRTNMAQLSQFTSALVLRVFDAGHAVLNMTSLAATMPPVIKALNKLPDETVEQYATRVGAYGITLDGNQLAQFSPVRLMMSTFHEMFNNPEYRTMWQKASKAGLFDQEVAEIMRTITAPRQGYAQSILSKFVDKASFLSDKSERLSRAFSFASGYHLARRGLKLNEDNAVIFAHRFANDVIGDYRPNARPRIFQGAAGMPIGLFMTFMHNYYQRIFGYIENKQTAALVTQFATQASIFGASSVPGFQQFSDFFYTNYDGTVNPVDGITKHLGNDLGEFFLYGALSNLPKMFGADDGVALFTRGDINFQRIPGYWSFDQTPVANMATQFFGAFRKSLQSLRENEGLNTQQLMEIAGQYSISRPFRGLMEVLSGYATDKRGQVINSEVYEPMALAARAIGMRTLNEMHRIKTYARVRNTDRSQRYRTMQLRDRIRSSIRAGNLDAETLNGAIADYVKYGGQPEYFGRWLATQVQTATVDRDARELIEALKDKGRGNDVLRLMSSLRLSPNDPEFEN